MPPAHFLNAPTYRRRHHGGSGAHRRRDRGDHQKLLISLLILCKTEDVSTSSVLFYCQTLSLRASPQTGVAIRIPSLSPSVGVGVPDDPPLTAAPPLIPRRTAPMCAAADHRRTFNPCHCEPARTLVRQSVPPLRRTPVIWKNGFPRRFAPRNDIFIIPPALRRGRRPRRPARTAPLSRRRGDPCGRPSHSPNPVIARRIAPWQSVPLFCRLRRGRCPHRPAPHRTLPLQKYRAPVSPPTRDPYFFHPA